MLIISMSLVLVLMLICILASLRLQRGRKRAQLLLYAKNDREVRLPPLLTPVLGYHVFLSHVWVSGQDQMRILKQRLLAMMPGIRVFLDVDDLRSGRGGEDINRSNVVLVFISSGYFSSQNCMRELLRAVATGKPILTMCETSANKGALTRDEVMASLRTADRRYHEVWGDAILAEEARKWLDTPEELCPRGLALCRAISTQQSVAEDLDSALYGELGPIEWTRVDAFQNITIRLIAERILTKEGTDATYMKSVRAQERRIFSQMLNVLLNPQQDFHLFYSPHNTGAFELVCEASSFFEWKLTAGDAAGGDSCGWGVGREDSTPTVGSHKLGGGAASAPPPGPCGQRTTAWQLSAVGNGLSQPSAPGAPPSTLTRSNTNPKPPSQLACSNTQKLRRTIHVWNRGGRQTLRVTSDPDDLTCCRQMLVYLNAQTWTSGERSALLAADVKAALDEGVDLLLVHETPDVHGASGSKNGVDFGKFFACADGATPPDLIQANIYQNVAVPLKDGAFRPASMLLFADHLAQYEKFRRTRLLAQTRWHKWSRLVQFLSWQPRPDKLPTPKKGRPAMLPMRSPLSRRTLDSQEFIDF